MKEWGEPALVITVVAVGLFVHVDAIVITVVAVGLFVHADLTLHPHR